MEEGFQSCPEKVPYLPQKRALCLPRKGVLSPPQRRVLCPLQMGVRLSDPQRGVLGGVPAPDPGPDPGPGSVGVNPPVVEKNRPQGALGVGEGAQGGVQGAGAGCLQRETQLSLGGPMAWHQSLQCQG